MASPRNSLVRLLLLSQALISYVHSEDADWSEETKLRKVLFTEQTIDKHSRPIQYHNETIEVDMDLLINHVLALNEKTEVLSLNAWIFHRWQDMHFRWSPDNYGGLTYLPVSTEQIWLPDVYLLNSAKAIDTRPVANVSAVLDYGGIVYWFPPTTLHSVCPLDLQKFPFDTQICILQFCSWTYWGDQLNLTMYHENLSLTPYLFDEHNEWEITHSFGNRNIIYYGSYPFIIAEFHVHLRRRAPYYSLALIGPTVTAMIMTLAVFWIPPVLEEKFILAGITEVILALLLGHLYWVVPRSGSNVPGIIILCGNAMLFAGLSIVIAVFVTSVARKPLLPPTFTKILQSELATKILFLPDQINSLSGNTQLLQNDDEQASRLADHQAKSFDWYRAAVAIDRIAFFLYVVIFLILVVSTFG